MAYLDENFLLHSPTARRLFHEVAKEQPIIDYHCHLSPREIATNHRWNTISEIWLGGDHYKWRLMRANGIDESLITGDSSPREKFQAWAETVPFTLRNPIHHWTHIELQRYFGVDLLLSPATADEIWDRTNAILAEPHFSTHGLLNQFDVRVVGTTDDPADSLVDHLAIAASDLKTWVVPTFRPDKALLVDHPEWLNPWLQKLEQVSGISIIHLCDLLAALQQRHEAFHEAGARLSDHGLDRLPNLRCSDEEAAMIFARARDGLAGRERKILVLSDGVFRSIGRREGLDQAAPPGGCPKRELTDGQAVGARHGI
jgi:glucuronate isomerase